MEEILYRLRCRKPVVNNGITYQPQLVIAGFLNHQRYQSFWIPSLSHYVPPQVYTSQHISLVRP